MEPIRGNLYDYPLYYDLVFGSDFQAEMRFLQGCFERFVRGKAKTLFEPACGTGRLVYRLAKKGYKVSGLDLNPHAVEFCNARLKRMELPATVFVGDMSDFTLKKPVDAAFNTINSFRHLRTEESAQAHLRCVARAVRSGGIYVLGLHLTPTQGTPIEEESWSARRGNLQVNTRMWTISRSMRRREELCGMEILVQKPTGSMCIEDEIIFRTYTWPQMKSLLESVPEWEIAATFDFAYDLRRETPVDAESEDVVFILRRG